MPLQFSAILDLWFLGVPDPQDARGRTRGEERAGRAEGEAADSGGDYGGLILD